MVGAVSDLRKGSKKFGQIFIGNAYPVVFNFKFNADFIGRGNGFMACFDGYNPGIGKLDGVADQIYKDLT